MSQAQEDPTAPPVATHDAAPWVTPGEALARRPGARAEAPARAPAAPARYGFRAGSLSLVIDSAKSGEVLEDVPIYPLPNTPEWLSGLINVRGNLVPVFDLRRLTGEQAQGTSDSRLLLLGAAADAVAFPITKLPAAVHLGAALEQQPAVFAPLDDHVRAAYLVDDELWLDVDLDAFLLSLNESTAT